MTNNLTAAEIAEIKNELFPELAEITRKANLLFPESPQGYIAAACEYSAEIKRLTEWKESANEILKNIDLQECGKALGLQPGADISKHILPAVIEVKRLREGIKKLANDISFLSDFEKLAILKRLQQLLTTQP